MSGLSRTPYLIVMVVMVVLVMSRRGHLTKIFNIFKILSGQCRQFSNERHEAPTLFG